MADIERKKAEQKSKPEILAEEVTGQVKDVTQESRLALQNVTSQFTSLGVNLDLGQVTQRVGDGLEKLSIQEVFDRVAAIGKINLGPLVLVGSVQELEKSMGMIVGIGDYFFGGKGVDEKRKQQIKNQAKAMGVDLNQIEGSGLFNNQDVADLWMVISGLAQFSLRVGSDLRLTILERIEENNKKIGKIGRLGILWGFRVRREGKIRDVSGEKILADVKEIDEVRKRMRGFNPAISDVEDVVQTGSLVSNMSRLIVRKTKAEVRIADLASKAETAGRLITDEVSNESLRGDLERALYLSSILERNCALTAASLITGLERMITIAFNVRLEGLNIGMDDYRQRAGQALGMALRPAKRNIDNLLESPKK
jgi:hypothetical protein